MKIEDLGKPNKPIKNLIALVFSTSLKIIFLAQHNNITENKVRSIKGVSLENLIKQITSHRSIRRYRNQKIPEETLTKILHAGTRAATSGNMQFYSIIVTKDESLKKELYQAHMQQRMVLEAPVVLTICADQARLNQWFELNSAKYQCNNLICLFRGIIDACLVAQNIALASEALGLGICYMGSTLMGSDKIINILDLPNLVIPVTSLVIGYPDENPPLVNRLPLEGVVHSEKYQSYSNEQINQIFKDKESETKERWARNNIFQEEFASGALNNVADAYTKMKFSKEDLEKYSATLEKILKSNWQL